MGFNKIPGRLVTVDSMEKLTSLNLQNMNRSISRHRFRSALASEGPIVNSERGLIGKSRIGIVEPVTTLSTSADHLRFLANK